jgi:hypothetical protein
MIALLFPAALVFIIWTDPGLFRQPRRWTRPLLAGLLPLLLYVYLPLRGAATSSLDGTYQPTLYGTLEWITARAYSVFLTGNPFGVERSVGDVAALFLDQCGALLLVAALMGLLTAWRYSLRRYVFLLLALTAQAAFASVYKVQDVGVFFLPAFMLVALWAAWGLTPILDGVAVYAVGIGRGLHLPRRSLHPLMASGALLVAVIFLAEPVRAAIQRYDEQNLSGSWAVYEAGRDMLESVAPNGRVAGLLGEMTLMRYFRDVLGRRPDVTLIPADSEAARFAAIADGLAAGDPVYLTRDLPGVAMQYSLDAAGPLIRIGPKAAPTTAPPGASIGAGVLLVDASAEMRQNRAGTSVRVRPVWAATEPIHEELKVSARLLDSAGQQIAADDRVPVHFTYPMTAWTPGETVEDLYDLKLPDGAPQGPYRVLLILYRASDTSEVGRAEVAVP